MPTFALLTFSCKVNQYEGQALREALARRWSTKKERLKRLTREAARLSQAFCERFVGREVEADGGYTERYLRAGGAAPPRSSPAVGGGDQVGLGLLAPPRADRGGDPAQGDRRHQRRSPRLERPLRRPQLGRCLVFIVRGDGVGADPRRAREARP